MKLTVAVTGVSGFVGKRFCEYNTDKYNIIPLNLRDGQPQNLFLSGVDIIVHLAGKAHQMEPISDKIYFDINYSLTRELALQAIKFKVPHFIYISSTKVYGDEKNIVLDERTVCTPTDAYGASKFKAEQFLRSLTAINVAIIRPPLIYGPNVKGNMLKLLELADKKLPLPFGNIQNTRSLVFIDNLIELINTIIEAQAAGLFIAGDKKPLSTNALIILIRKYLNNASPIFSLPFFIRKLIKAIKPSLFIRLFGSYIVDNSYTNQALNFVPPYSTEYGIEKMVKWFNQQRK